MPLAEQALDAVFLSAGATTEGLIILGLGEAHFTAPAAYHDPMMTGRLGKSTENSLGYV
jgi:hypothetical protein